MKRNRLADAKVLSPKPSRRTAVRYIGWMKQICRAHLGLLAAVALSLTALATAPARSATPVDLELVLAVDASSSVTQWEFELQMRGVADAFRDPEVQGAIQAAGDLGIAVALVQWSGRDRQVLAVDWMQVFDPSSAEEFAAQIDNAPRYIVGGSTALGNAIAFSYDLLTFNAYEGRRRVMDLSGDGRTNQGIQTSKARDRVVDQGVIINGLAILNEDPSVDAYYLGNVIGGFGSFVMTAIDYNDFARAIRLKLLREVAGPPLARGPGESDGELAGDTGERHAQTASGGVAGLQSPAGRGM